MNQIAKKGCIVIAIFIGSIIFIVNIAFVISSIFGKDKPSNLSEKKIVKIISKKEQDSIDLAYKKRKDSIDSANVIVMKQKEKLKEEVKKAFRKEFETTLRNGFLDNGMDVKVKVSGKDNEIIKLSFILHNDVWLRKYEREGYFKKLNEQGFKKIIISDGYDYNMTVTYN